MSIFELDRNGGVTLPKKIRGSLGIGEKVLVINAGDHLKIIPLPSNPIQILHGTFNIKNFSKTEGGAELTAEREAKKYKN